MEANKMHTDELERMRRDMSELRSLLSEQQIVNERLVRRAMNADMSKEKRDIMVSIAVAAIAIPAYVYFLPQYGLPGWFTVVTAAYFLACCVASLWSLRQLAAEDIITGELVAVAERIVAYRRFGNRWLCGAIPAVALWLAGFVYYTSAAMTDADEREGFFCGCVIGLVWGGTFGTLRLLKSRRRLKGILQQIEEVKNAE